MKDFESKVGKMMGDNERLSRLLSLEKKRRGVAQDSLTFVGMADIAKHWWCTQQAVLSSRVMEAGFFASYLHDRIIYAHRLGFVDTLPRRDEALLDIGNEITFADVQKLFTKQEDTDIRVSWEYQDVTDEQGQCFRVINPALLPEERELYEKEASNEGIQLKSIEEVEPKLRGELLHLSRAEQYPSIRWNFPWEKYTIIGIPDGITDNFVYEYKTTRNRFLFRFMKPVAYAQADLYGYFFERPQKRVQIQVVEENATETYEETVSAANVERTLNAFARVEAGEPAFPPKPWKCRPCDFRETCPISAAD